MVNSCDHLFCLAGGQGQGNPEGEGGSRGLPQSYDLLQPDAEHDEHQPDNRGPEDDFPDQMVDENKGEEGREIDEDPDPRGG